MSVILSRTCFSTSVQKLLTLLFSPFTQTWLTIWPSKKYTSHTDINLKKCNPFCPLSLHTFWHLVIYICWTVSCLKWHVSGMILFLFFLQPCHTFLSPADVQFMFSEMVTKCEQQFLRFVTLIWLLFLVRVPWNATKRLKKLVALISLNGITVSQSRHSFQLLSVKWQQSGPLLCTS